jgi:hypothetical protein
MWPNVGRNQKANLLQQICPFLDFCQKFAYRVAMAQEGLDMADVTGQGILSCHRHVGKK